MLSLIFRILGAYFARDDVYVSFRREGGRSEWFGKTLVDRLAGRYRVRTVPGGETDAKRRARVSWSDLFIVVLGPGDYESESLHADLAAAKRAGKRCLRLLHSGAENVEGYGEGELSEWLEQSEHPEDFAALLKSVRRALERRRLRRRVLWGVNFALLLILAAPSLLQHGVGLGVWGQPLTASVESCQRVHHGAFPLPAPGPAPLAWLRPENLRLHLKVLPNPVARGDESFCAEDPTYGCTVYYPDSAGCTPSGKSAGALRDAGDLARGLELRLGSITGTQQPSLDETAEGKHLTAPVVHSFDLNYRLDLRSRATGEGVVGPELGSQLTLQTCFEPALLPAWLSPCRWSELQGS